MCHISEVFFPNTAVPERENQADSLDQNTLRSRYSFSFSHICIPLAHFTRERKVFLTPCSNIDHSSKLGYFRLLHQK